MQSRIPHFGIGVKNAAKNELLSPSERDIKKLKKHQTLPEEATPTT